MMDKNYSSKTVALGFDIGGTKTKIGLVTSHGEIIAEKTFHTDLVNQSLKVYIEEFFMQIHHLLDSSPINVLGIGGTFLGWIDDDRSGPFLCQNVPVFHGLDLKALLEHEFNLPVSLIDDANAHALAEYTFGNGRGMRRFMSVALGTGIGIAMMIDGKPLDFTSGCIGDAGHIILRPGGPTCSAGCKGCSEALIGVAGIERLGLEKYGVFKPAYEIIRLAKEGEDSIAVEIMQEIGGFVGEMLASLIHIFLPDRIVLAGGTMNAGQVLLDATQKRFDALVGDYYHIYTSLSHGYYHKAEIVMNTVQGETGVIGSVVNLFNHLGIPATARLSTR